MPSCHCDSEVARVGAVIPGFGDAGSPSGRIEWPLTPAGRYCPRPWPDTPWTNPSRVTFLPALPAPLEAIGLCDFQLAVVLAAYRTVCPLCHRNRGLSGGGHWCRAG